MHNKFTKYPANSQNWLLTHKKFLIDPSRNKTLQVHPVKIICTWLQYLASISCHIDRQTKQQQCPGHKQVDQLEFSAPFRPGSVTYVGKSDGN